MYNDLLSKITLKYLENNSSHERIREILVLVLWFSLPVVALYARHGFIAKRVVTMLVIMLVNL